LGFWIPYALVLMYYKYNLVHKKVILVFLNLFLFFFIFFIEFIFLIFPNYFSWLWIWHCYFLRFVFLWCNLASWSFHGVWSLGRVSFVFLCFFFCFVSQHWISWRLTFIIFITFFSIRLFWSHVIMNSAGSLGLTWVFFVVFFLILSFNIRLVWELSFTILFDLLSTRSSRSHD
jgi:hypothetical protein